MTPANTKAQIPIVLQNEINHYNVASKQAFEGIPAFTSLIK